MKVNPIEMQNSLGGVNYPASKKQIIDQAKTNGASQEVRKALGALPEKEYDSPAAINKEVGKGA
ncbi:DUF2795 domain-containing protein [Streptomyces sp. ISL-98]|uniref:DUF2795 domain-containing protein n=1 Tax=Streptomyces sp. ISL-98 TaxID=2819192 RepID=UPI001BE610F3|nr:DUF2795 domain-containing protein [Streptomyces sp. ISL-98]MBT2507808.1 DUF2795 domain-containing protein [Streptomyces sp. ISL-98]